MKAQVTNEYGGWTVRINGWFIRQFFWKVSAYEMAHNLQRALDNCNDCNSNSKKKA